MMDDNPLESVRNFLQYEGLSIFEDNPGVLSLSFNETGEQARIADSLAAPVGGKGPNGVPHGLDSSALLRGHLRDFLQADTTANIIVVTDNVFFCQLPVRDSAAELAAAMTRYADHHHWAVHSAELSTWIKGIFITACERVPRNIAAGRYTPM